MKKTLLSLSIAAAAVSVPAQAADIGNGLDLSGNMALASEYVWRGNTQTDGKPTIQGGLDLVHESGFYVGTWAANVNSDTTSSYTNYGGSEMEVDLYVGYATELAGVGLDVGYLSYNYPGSSPASDFEEIYAGVSKSLGSVDLGFTYYWGQDEFASGSNVEDYWEISAGTELAGLGLGFTYGEYDNLGDNYSLGVSKELLSEKWPVEVSLMYYDYDSDSGTADEDGFVFAVAKSF